MSLRDFLIAWVRLGEALEAEANMTKMHKRFNTRLGFPVVYCSSRRMSLTDSFPLWQKNARMTNDLSQVTCENCKRELGISKKVEQP
jgi:hypothetical protein